MMGVVLVAGGEAARGKCMVPIWGCTITHDLYSVFMFCGRESLGDNARARRHAVVARDPEHPLVDAVTVVPSSWDYLICRPRARRPGLIFR